MIEFINDEGDCVPVEPLLDNITFNLTEKEALLLGTVIEMFIKLNNLVTPPYSNMHLSSSAAKLHNKIMDQIVAAADSVP